MGRQTFLDNFMGLGGGGEGGVPYGVINDHNKGMGSFINTFSVI